MTEVVRRYLPVVAAPRSSKRASWRLDAHIATLTAGGDTWRLEIDPRVGGGHCRTYVDRHDAFTAHIAASNIVVHFDLRYSAGIK